LGGDGRKEVHSYIEILQTSGQGYPSEKRGVLEWRGFRGREFVSKRSGR